MNDEQTTLTFYVVLAAIGFLLIALLVTIFVFKDKESPAEIIVAVMGAVTGILGTLVGYVAGQSGKQEAERRASSAEGKASKAEQKLTAVVDAGGSNVLAQAKQAYPELFKD